MRGMRLGHFSPAALAMGAWLLAAPAMGQAGPVFQMDFSHPGLTPPHWTLTLRPDGSGHFHADESSGKDEAALEIKIPALDREIRVSAGFAANVFEAARQQRLFKGDCDSHMKVAFEGWKKLSYSGPEGQWGCAYNYTKDKAIEDLGDQVEAVAETIVEGARLEMLLVYDRLGLDAEMEYLKQAVGDGQARELCAIRGTLERLAEDPEVMARVRRQARTLLTKAGSGK